jgi:hypothetical protein
MGSPPYPPLPHTFLSPLKSYFKFPFRSPIASMSLLSRISPSPHSYLNQFTHISSTFPSISMLFLLHLSMGSTPYLLHTASITIYLSPPTHFCLESSSYSSQIVLVFIPVGPNSHPSIPPSYHSISSPFPFISRSFLKEFSIESMPYPAHLRRALLGRPMPDNCSGLMSHICDMRADPCSKRWRGNEKCANALGAFFAFDG